MKIKRIIYCLYFMEGYFFLSRNFRLQKVGDLDWLNNNFKFDLNSNFIDELMVVLVKDNPNNDDFEEYFRNVEKLRKNIFIPLILGGGIKTVELSKRFFDNGADKILINSSAYRSKEIVNEIADYFGSQAISIGIDYKRNGQKIELYSNCGKILENTEFKTHLENLENMNCGEIIINSIDNDGNGAGLDLEITSLIKKNFSKPMLLMGGAGKPEHFSKGLQIDIISGIVSANLFNFLGSGLKNVRTRLAKDKINIAKFE